MKLATMLHGERAPDFTIKACEVKKAIGKWKLLKNDRR